MSLLESAGPARRRFYSWLLNRLGSVGDEPQERQLGTEAPPWLRRPLLSLALHPETPDFLRQRLRAEAHRTAAANLMLIQHFRRIAEALEGLAFAPLKGIFLLDRIYPDDISSRPMSDIDLLVPAGESEEAISRLSRELGLREVPEGAGAAERCLATEGLVVEVHDRLGIKHGWASTWDEVAPRPGQVHGCSVWVLDEETTFVHLMAHFVKHGPFVDLRWVEDLLRWRERDLDPERIEARARHLGAWRTLVAGARALRRGLGEEIFPELPGASLRGLGTGVLAFHERVLWSYLGDDPLAAYRRSGPLHRNLTALLLADHPLDSIRFLRAKLSELRRRHGS